MNHPICPFCNLRPADLLCDFVIGPEWKGQLSECWGKPYRCTSRDSVVFTCDRPMCQECSTNKGIMHWSGENHGAETIDYCPQCEVAPEKDIKPISAEEAQFERAQMWKRSVGIFSVVT